LWVHREAAVTRRLSIVGGLVKLVSSAFGTLEKTKALDCCFRRNNEQNRASRDVLMP
jgi:hypothetical protein